MPAVATAFNWVFAPGGTFTRIGMGPLIALIPSQALELAQPGGARLTVTWALDTYTAVPPFFSRNTGTIRPPGTTGQPTGHFGPSFWAAVLWFPPSPWTEFWLMPSSGVWAHIALF
jgi:hypothetical protein